MSTSKHSIFFQSIIYRAMTYSTETAVIAVHDSIVRTIDAGDVCAFVLLDLSSAFDTFDHEHLCKYYSSVLESKTSSNLVWFVPV